MKIRHSVDNNHRKPRTPSHTYGFTTRLTILIVAGIILYIGLNVFLFRLGRYSVIEQSINFFRQQRNTVPTTTPIPPTPTPTPKPLRPITDGPHTFRFSRGKTATGPKIQTATVDPLNATSGTSQKVTIVVTNDSDITSAAIRVTTDSKVTTVPLTLTQGTQSNGTWEGSWTMPETHTYRYSIYFVLESPTGTYDNGMVF